MLRNNNIVIFLVFVFLLISCSAKNDNQKKDIKKDDSVKKDAETELTMKYYKDAELDFDDPMPRGKGELKKEDISKVEQWIFFFKDSQLHKIEVHNAYGKLDDAHGFSTWKFEYDEKKRIKKSSFYDKYDRPVKNRRGVYSVSYKYPDEKTRIEMYMDKKGELMRDIELSVGSKFTLGNDGKPIEQFYLGYKEQVVLNLYKIGGQKFTRDSSGKIIKVEFLDLEGKPIARYMDKAASFEIKYDERGNAIERRYFDEKGKLVESLEGFAVARQEFDEFNNPQKLVVYDAKEQIKFQTKTESNKYGQPSWKAYFDKNDKPIPYKGKIHKEKYTYNDHGQELTISFFDVTDKPATDQNGVHKVMNKYDEKGNLLERSYFNLEGNLKALKDGIASTVYTYDDDGNVTSKKYLNEENKLIEDTEGIALYKYKRDKFGMPVEEFYFNKDEKPVKNSFFIYGVRNKFDEDGNIIEEYNLDEKGQLMANKSGFYSYKNVFDKEGNRTERTGYDKDGKIAANPEGIATLKIKYNEQGKPLEVGAYGIDGKLVNPKSRPAVEKYIYGVTGVNWIEQSFFDAEGNPTEFKGVHKIKLVKQGDKEGYVPYDKSGKPVMMKQ
ncbi:MAG: hypothetical protein JXA60_00430 [Candidatus Coatesbacteria bacterium]|nr:hypothetical protein [Candidatus Coatesbacteria bacterium]